ncbi:MAG: hypothetical protein WCS65_13270 [Verrucomicrobiae bacterium]
MKRLALAAAIAIAPACERHPASETVPGYAEMLAKKSAEEKVRAETPGTVNLDPPKFFPRKNFPRKK